MTKREQNRKSQKSSSTRSHLSLETLEERVVLNAGVYSIDGTGNNLDNPDWGSTDIQLIRITLVEYGDGVSSPAGEDRPSARDISNALAAQTEFITDDRYLTDLTWLWGQFIDHDIDLTENADPAEPFNISVPTGDPYFDPFNTGTVEISLNRSIYDTSTGDSTDNPRQQVNLITAFLDGSVIYGSDEDRANALRAFSGGKLKTSDGDLLPFNLDGYANAGGPSDTLFLAGDVRANENAALSAMHTLWVREHNYWAERIAAENPTLTDEGIYQQARAIVTAELQAITYNEFLPALLGPDAISPYRGYDPTVDAGIANIFSTAAYRFGHSMLSSELLRLNNDGTVIADGNLSLSDAFFAPNELIDNGIDSLLLGAASQKAQVIDTQVVDDVRNFLFGPPGAGGFDLASLNIQRGRDHGLPDYNQARIDLGLEPVDSFEDVTSNTELAAQLEAVYGDVNNIDVWVGGLAEDHVEGASVGELIYTVLVDQFTRIRDGDRLWYQNQFSGGQLRQIENTSLSDVIERNTNITGLRENVFFADTVLYQEGNAGRGAMDVRVVTQNGQVEIINNRTHEVLQSQAVDTVDQVMLVGQDRADDRFIVQMNPAIDMPGGVMVIGGHRDRDVLIVHGTPDPDQILVTPEEIVMDGLVISYSSINQLIIEAHSGNDVIEMAPGVNIPVVVQGGEGDDILMGDVRGVDFNGGPGQDEVIPDGEQPSPRPCHRRGPEPQQGPGDSFVQPLDFNQNNERPRQPRRDKTPSSMDNGLAPMTNLLPPEEEQ